MMICIKCWNNAYSHLNTSQTVTEYYKCIVKKRNCSKAEQVFGENYELLYQENLVSKINRTKK